MKYKTKDVFGVLPIDLHNAAIEYSKEKTGVSRPHKSHTVYIETFRDCFKMMQDLNMLKKEYRSGSTKKSGNRKTKA